MTDTAKKAVFEIEDVKPEEGKFGPYIRVTVSGGDKFNCFDKPLPNPKAGEYWEADLERKGKYLNLVNMKHLDAPPEKTQTLIKTEDTITPDNKIKPTHGQIESRRQTLIIRQSCLKAAVEMVVPNQKNEDAESVKKLAEIFEEWVTRE